jgi:RsiW-degrading membrane proteinase PrsW (M82 family)
MAKRPGGVMIQSTIPTHSQLIPVLTKWKDLRAKSEFIPMLVTIITVLLLFPFMNEDPIEYTFHVVIDGQRMQGTIYSSAYLILICAYLVLMSLYFIRRMAGKDKSWLALLGVAVFTGYFMWLFQVEGDFDWLYSFFHIKLAGGEVTRSDAPLQTFIKHFLGTGFFEETVKAIPLFLLVIAGSYMPADMRSKYGIEEPLDGILLGAASGGGFAFMETIGQYVSDNLVDQWKLFSAVYVHGVDPRNVDAWYAKLDPATAHKVLEQGKGMLGWAPGLPLLIPRILHLSFGHMAYAGYFGYFIGLSVLKPEQRWKILGIGLVSASIPHALWDSIDSTALQAVVGVLCYAVLAAAILKAREISPNRAVLQPSIFAGSLSPLPAGAGSYAVAPVVAAAVAPVYAAASAPKPVQVAVGPNPLPAGTSSLRIGAKYLVIVPGLRLMAHQIPGLDAQAAEGLVAEVTRNPNDPGVLGLTNLSTTTWEVVTTSGTRREINPGQTIKLAPGTKIDFGSTDGEVK